MPKLSAPKFSSMQLGNKASLALGLFLLVAFTGCSSTGGKSEKRKREAEPQTSTASQGAAVGAGSATANTAQPDSESQQMYRRAIAAMQNQQDANAEVLLDRILKSQPDFADARTNLGIVQFRAGRYERAEEEFKRAVKDDPKNTAAYNYLGILYRVNGQFNQSKLMYEQALSVDPGYANAALNLGILYDLYLQEYPKAMESYQRYQKLLPQEDKDVAKWIADLKRRIEKK